MATLICNGTGNLTGATTFAGAEVGALALVLNRNTTTAIAAATTVTSTTFTITTGKTVDAILLWLKVTAASPTGTLKVDLQKSAVSQGSVTVNKTDLPDSTNAIPIPVLFKLSAGGAGTSTSVWTIVITTTGTGTVTAAIASATATNFTRACRTTTAATPAAADDLYIIGELTGAGTHTARTVTMDSTAATAYGNGTLNSTTVAGGGIHVAYYGTLSYGNSASTNYLLRVAGDLIVYQQGPFNIGSLNAEIPRTSTAILEFQPASADGDFGLRCLDNAVVNGFGLSRTSGKNIVKCKMTADAAASGGAPSTSTLSVDTDTGWLSGDIIAIAATTRTAAECEFGDLNANAGASSIVVKDMTVGAAGNAIPPTSNRGLLAAHSGTTPTQAEIGLLTRNVKIRSTSTTLMTYVYCAALSTVNFSWVEMYYLGTNNANKRGLEVDGGSTTNAKSFTFCSIHDNDNQCAYFGGTQTSLNVTFSNNVIWQSAAQSAITISGVITNADYTFDSNLVIKVAAVGFSLNDTTGVITNNTVAGSGNYGFDLEFNGAIGTFSGNTAHSSAKLILIGTKMRGTIESFTGWRCSGAGSGLVFTSGWNHALYFNNLTLFGNNGTNITAWDTINLTGNCIVAGDTTFSSTNGILCGAAENNNLQLSGVDMSGTTSIFAAHTLNDIAYASTGTNITGVVKNCKVNAPTPDNTWSITANLSFEKYQQTAGDHRTVTLTGTVKTDTVIFNVASPSMRMTPSSNSSATQKLESAPQSRGFLVAVANGGTVNISVYIRKSAVGDGVAYTGNQPRLIQRANAALGQPIDVVLATYSAGTGAWNQLSGTSSVATDDGAWEFVIDCDGSAGWINIDDWAFNGVTSSTNDLKYWFNGLPNNTNAGTSVSSPGFSGGFLG